MKTRTIEDILNNFNSLLGYVLLFDKESHYFSKSGYVTAALLDFEENEGKKITILGLATYSGLLTIKMTREELTNLLRHCIEFVGKTEEESFVLSPF